MSLRAVVVAAILQSGCATDRAAGVNKNFRPSSTPGIGSDLKEAPHGGVITGQPGVDLVHQFRPPASARLDARFS
jgi:hypothetical protein